MESIKEIHIDKVSNGYIVAYHYKGVDERRIFQTMAVLIAFLAEFGWKDEK